MIPNFLSYHKCILDGVAFVNVYVSICINALQKSLYTIPERYKMCVHIQGALLVRFIFEKLIFQYFEK